MRLRTETVDRVTEFWRTWCAAHDSPNAVSVIHIGGELFVGAPERARARLEAAELTDLSSLVRVLGDDLERVGGEARLAYADTATLQTIATNAVIRVEDTDPRFAEMEADSDRSEWAEASADEPCDERFGVADGDALLAVATLRVWTETLGHIGVFTASPARDRGCASTVGSAAAERAITLGCVPQWRSRIGNDASARVADKLGFVVLGTQQFVRLRPDPRV